VSAHGRWALIQDMSKGYGHFGFDLACGVMEKNGLP
jgi:hypothetical protein